MRLHPLNGADGDSGTLAAQGRPWQFAARYRAEADPGDLDFIAISK
jgi:hypothetical protein